MPESNQQDHFEPSLIDRFRRLAMVAHALTGELEADEIMRIVLNQGMAGMDATGGAAAFLRGDDVVPVGAAGSSRASMARIGRMRLADDNPLSEAIRQGNPIWIRSRREGISRFTALALSSPTSQGWVCIPLQSGGRPFGAIALSFGHPPQFDEVDQQFILALADITSLALLQVFSRRRSRPDLAPAAAPTLEDLLAGATDALVVVDAEGSIVEVNEQVTRLLGHSRQQLLDRSVEVLLPIGVREGHAALRRRYVVEPVPRPFGSGMEILARRADGTEVPCDVALSPCVTTYGMCVVAVIRVVGSAAVVEPELGRPVAAQLSPAGVPDPAGLS